MRWFASGLLWASLVGCFGGSDSGQVGVGDPDGGAMGGGGTRHDAATPQDGAVASGHVDAGGTGDGDASTPSSTVDGGPSVDGGPAPPTGDAGTTPGGRCICPPTDNCGALTIPAVLPSSTGGGTVLFVHDRSGSMATDWGGVMRWEGVGDAVLGALASFTGDLTVGTLFFPSSDPNAMPVCIDPAGISCIFVPTLVIAPGTCLVNAITQSDQIDFRPPADFEYAFANSGTNAPIYAPIPESFTPLREALGEADAALANAPPGSSRSVVILTDGEPNCEWDLNAASAIVSGWAAMGIDVHLLTIPGVDDTTPLMQLATAGGTTPVFAADAASLEQELDAILASAASPDLSSCTIELEIAPDPTSDLHLVVIEGGTRSLVPRDAGGGAGWSVSGTTVELMGPLCDAALAGQFDSIRFMVGCIDLPELSF